jgi:NAD(P)-dependent dehydrogenase (short-subunit alcohol dehydrogenase family)
MPKQDLAVRKGAILVGASTGMGAALARILAQRSYRVALIARQVETLQAVCDEINARLPDPPGGPVATAYPHDVTRYDEVPALFDRIRRDLGAGGSDLDLLVYAAGVMPRGANGTWTFEEERATVESNVIGGMRWIGLAVAAMKAGGHGTIVGISSVAGDRGRKGNSAYMAAKAAMSTYLESLRYRLAGSGVRVVTVKPGFVATPMTAGLKTPKPLTVSAVRAATRIADLCDGGATVAYVPNYWRAIMRVIKSIPAPLMPKMPL